MAKPGRPQGTHKEIDKEQFEKLLAYRPTSWDVAGFFRVDRTTLLRFVKREYDMTFQDVRKLFLSKTKLLLIQKAIKKANEGNNEMLKFCLMNLAGWHNGYQKDYMIDDEDVDTELEFVDE